MFSKSGYNDNLKKLIKAKKADTSVVNTIKENLEIQISAKNNIKKNEREIKKLNATNEDKILIKTQTPIYNLKNYMNITMEIMAIKKQIKQKSNEVKELNKEIEKAELNNSKLEQEIDAQFKIYQENEIYLKAVKKLNKSSVSEESYAAYEKHIDNYENSIYSLEKRSTLPKPNAEDFVVILSILKKENENKEEPDQVEDKTATKRAATKTTAQKSKEGSKQVEDKTEPKKTTKKVATKTTAQKSKEGSKQVEDKTEPKKTAKKVAKKTTAQKSKEGSEQVEKKATTKRTATKTSTKKSKKEIDPAEKGAIAKAVVKNSN